MEDEKVEYQKRIMSFHENAWQYIEFLESLVHEVCDLANTYEDIGNVHDVQSYLDEEEADNLREASMLVDAGLTLMHDVQNLRNGAQS